MMTKRRPCIVVAVLCCLLAIATSSTAQPVTVYTFEDMSCGKWLSLRDHSDTVAF
jgi:hypothetical protein